MAKIEIDYFESIKLLEVALYSNTAVCETIKEKFIHEWYDCYNAREKKTFYDWLLRIFDRQGNHKSTNEKIDRILARYNPDNQFMVTVRKGKIEQTVLAYLFNNIYYIGIRNQHCEPSTIKKIKK